MPLLLAVTYIDPETHMQLTGQEVFDKVSSHLLRQMEKSENENGNCEYRMEIGGKTFRCAIGALIMDENYDIRMEGKGLNSDNGVLIGVLVKEGILSHDLLGNHDLLNDAKHNKMVGLLRGLQHVHDTVRVEEWLTYLNLVAEQFKLRPITNG